MPLSVKWSIVRLWHFDPRTTQRTARSQLATVQPVANCAPDLASHTQPPRGLFQHFSQTLSASPGHGPFQGATAGTLCGASSDLLHNKLPREPRGAENDNMVRSSRGYCRHCFRSRSRLVTGQVRFCPLIGCVANINVLNGDRSTAVLMRQQQVPF